MARRATEDTAYLERRGRQWHCIQDIPTGLRAHFLNKNGKPRKRLIECLKTSDLSEARRRRHAALALFEAKFEAARMQQAPERAAKNGTAWYEAILAAAAEQRTLIQRVQRGDLRGVWVDPNAPVAGDTDRERALSVARWAIDDEADAIADRHGEEAAVTYLEAVDGDVAGVKPATLIEPMVGRWLTEEDIEERSKGDHRLAMKELLAWAKKTDRRETVETFDRKVAGEYVTQLLGSGLDRSKTVAKRLWSLSSFWRFLIGKGHAEVNPWRDHRVNQNGRSKRDKQPERPFTVAELRKLLDGPADPVLHDLMRMALFSGARLEELALLRVRDIDPDDRTMAIQADPKTAASRRVVPIHSEVWPIVQARIARKARDAFALHELGPEPRPGRQRSMAISKAFGRYRINVGVTDKVEAQRRELVNFHSFRRTFVTLAEQAGQPESTIRSVVGHKRQGMTFGVYSGGPSLEQRRACVESVRLPTPATPQATASAAAA
jgi:integrase